MSNDLPIGIRVDTGDSVSKAKAVEDALHKTEDRADQLGRSLTGVAGKFRSLGESIRQQLSAQAHAAGQAMRGLADAVALEARMLEMATGRTRDFGYQVAALQRLHEQGRISAEQYINALGRLNAMPKPGSVEMGNPIANQRAQTQQAIDTIGFGSAKPSSIAQPGMMAKFGGGVTGAAAAAGGAAMLAHAAIEANDKWVELENSVRKFEQPGRSAGTVLQNLGGLAHDLHQPLDETIQLFDGVEGATKDLGISQKEMIDISRTLGQVMLNDGKSIGDAAGMLEQLEYAMSIGSISGGALQKIMKQFPDIADIWTQSLGVTRKELLALAEKGQLDVSKLVTSLRNGGDAAKKFEERGVTLGQRWDEFKKELGKPISFDAIEDMYNPIKRAERAMFDFMQIHDRIRAQFEKQTLAQGVGALRAGIDGLNSSLATLGQRVAWAFGKDAWAGSDDLTGLLSLLPKGSKLMMEHAAAVGAARKQYDEMKASHAAGVATAREVQKAHEDLATVLNGGELPATIRLWHDIHDPIDNYRRDVQALDTLLKSHSITVDQHAAKLRELTNAYFGFDVQKFLGNETAADRALRASAADRAAQQAETDLMGRLEHEASFTKIERYQAEVAQLNRLVDEGRLSLDAYLVARQKAFESAGGSGEASGDFSAPGVDFAGIKGNLSKSAKGIKENEDALAELRKEELKKTKEAINDVIKTVEPLGEALGKALRGGDNAAEDLLDTLTQVGFKLLELGAISAFGPAGGIGAGFLKGLLGGKHGFDHVIKGGGVELPGFATGGDAMIGGPYRGTDKTLVAFWGTAGESLHVRTPDQRAAGGMGGAPQVIVRPIFQMPDMGKQIAEYFDGYGGEVAVHEAQRRSRRSRRTS